MLENIAMVTWFLSEVGVGQRELQSLDFVTHWPGLKLHVLLLKQRSNY